MSRLGRDATPLDELQKDGEKKMMRVRLLLGSIRQLRQIHVERDDGDGNLPAFEDFWVDFADHADWFTGHDNVSRPALQERRMLHRLQAVLLPEMVKQHIEAGVDLGEMRGRMGEDGAEYRVRARTQLMGRVRNRHVTCLEETMGIEGSV